jgi:hypothetical protein
MGCLFPSALNIDGLGVSQQLLYFFDFFAGFDHLKGSRHFHLVQSSPVQPLKAPIFASKRF